MFRKLLPTSVDFFSFFAAHAQLMVKGADTLFQLTSNKMEASLAFHQIKTYEQEADEITHACIAALHKTFITPIDRLEIHRLISTMDDVLDSIEQVARYMRIYKIHHFENEGNRLVENIVNSCLEIKGALEELPKMKNTAVMQRHYSNIDQLEHDSDTLFMQMLGHLFENERDPLMILKQKEIYEHLEEATDLCEDVSNILEGIVLENE